MNNIEDLTLVKFKKLSGKHILIPVNNIAYIEESFIEESEKKIGIVIIGLKQGHKDRQSYYVRLDKKITLKDVIQKLEEVFAYVRNKR